MKIYCSNKLELFSKHMWRLARDFDLVFLIHIVALTRVYFCFAFCLIMWILLFPFLCEIELGRLF